jgi:hypothetical protein
MGHKVDSFQSNDGVLFTSEEAMLIHEATVDLQEEFPNLKMQIPYIIANVNRIAAILAPIHALNERPVVLPSAARQYMPCPASGQAPPVRHRNVGWCHARQHSDQMTCGRCDLTWDVNDSSPPPCRTTTSLVQPVAALVLDRDTHG